MRLRQDTFHYPLDSLAFLLFLLLCQAGFYFGAYALTFLSAWRHMNRTSLIKLPKLAPTTLLTLLSLILHSTHEYLSLFTYLFICDVCVNRWMIYYLYLLECKLHETWDPIHLIHYSILSLSLN